MNDAIVLDNRPEYGTREWFAGYHLTDAELKRVEAIDANAQTEKSNATTA